MPITGTHALLYTSEPEALRACLRDVFGWSHVDVHDGWLIFALPPAELGVHPAEAPAHELTFMCDDITATLRRPISLVQILNESPVGFVRRLLFDGPRRVWAGGAGG